MKKTILIIPLLVCLASALQAGMCTPGTLATYDVSGFTCTINGLTFSNFGYTTADSGGASAPDAGGVTVTPITVGPEVGFQFQAAWLVGSLQTEDSAISYSAECIGCLISDVVLSITGTAGGTGIGGVSEKATPPLPDSPVGLNTSVSSGFSQFSDMKLFSPPVGSLDLSKDIGVSGGKEGTAHISIVNNLFSTTTTTTTPEPSLILMCSGFLCLLPFARRKMRGV